MKRSPLRNKTPLRRKTPPRASNRFPSKGDPGAAAAANEAVPVSLEALRFPKPTRKAPAAPKPIKRSWMKKKRARRIDRETPREKIYKAWIHDQPCAARHVRGHVCSGRIEQSHERSIAKGSGTGVKLNNFESWAFCWQAARDWDKNEGIFDRWPKARRLRYSAARVVDANARFEAEHATRAA